MIAENTSLQLASANLLSSKIPKFSIIIPVYNVAPYLRECLDSVLAQTYTDWEAICVDDGSTDGSGAILDEYAARDPRFRVIHKENGRVASARNAALDVACGDILLFIDSDDWISPNALIELANAFKEVDFDIARYSHVRVDNTGKNPSKAAVGGEWCSTSLWRAAFRHALVKGIRFKDFIFGEDRLYFIEAFDRAKRFTEVECVTYFYRQSNVSATHSKMTTRKVADELFADIDILRIIEGKHKAYSQRFIKIVLGYMTTLTAAHFMKLTEDDMQQAWPIWRKVLREVSGMTTIPMLYRVFLWIASTCFSIKMCEYLFFRIHYNRYIGAIRRLKGLK